MLHEITLSILSIDNIYLYEYNKTKLFWSNLLDVIILRWLKGNAKWSFSTYPMIFFMVHFFLFIYFFENMFGILSNLWIILKSSRKKLRISKINWFQKFIRFFIIYFILSFFLKSKLIISITVRSKSVKCIYECLILRYFSNNV